MKPEERRGKERAEVRVRILDAAREEFLDRGIEGATMRRIAEKAGYSTGALVHHFRDKDSLILALCELDFAALRHSFDRIARVVDPVERIHKLGMAYVRFALANPRHYQFLFMTRHEPRDPKAFRIEAGNPEQDAYAFLRLVVAQAIEAGRVREEYDDADLVAQVLWSGVHGVVALHMTHQGKDPWIVWRPIEKRARLMLDATLRGIVREPGGSGNAAGRG